MQEWLYQSELLYLIPAEQAVRDVTLTVIDALTYLHSLGLVHYSVEPQVSIEHILAFPHKMTSRRAF